MSTYSIDIVFSPDLLPAYSNNKKTCVVIDIFRASTTMVTALYNGATAIYPISSVEQAEAMATAGKLVGAERNVVRCPFAHFGNDPMEYTPDAVRGQEIYFTTTNGTHTIVQCAQQGHEVVIGAFINLQALTAYLQDRSVLCVCAGWQGRYCLEDALFAGALVDALSQSHVMHSDAARVMCELWQIHKHDLESYLKQCDHYARLEHAHKCDAVPYCLTLNSHNVVPIVTLDQGALKCTLTK